MIRVAFTLIGGRAWTGGYNYLRNLLAILSEEEGQNITPILFFGDDAPDDDVSPFRSLAGIEIVRSALLDQRRKSFSLAKSLVLGRDDAVHDLFVSHRVGAVFESAAFFGWRNSLPSVAWIPDFQHRELRHLFSFAGYWKRELGFQAQVASGRVIMLSSDDSRSACERYYPRTRGRTRTVHFAVPPGTELTVSEVAAVARRYGLTQPFFLLPNQFWFHKNHLLVIEALAMLQHRGKRVLVAASGQQTDPRDPTHFPRVLSSIQQHDLTDSFRLLGLVPYADLRALMQGAVAVLNPSLFEGWSTSVEEARALGAPMVLSDLAVHREQAGAAATYFDPHSALSLSYALESFRPLPPTERANRAAVAKQDARRRVRAFAREFVLAIESAMG